MARDYYEVEIPLIETELVRTRRNPDDDDPTPKRYRIPKYHIELVREGGFWVPERQLSRPSAVYALAREITGKIDRETFYVICLDQKNQCIGVNLVSLGTLTAAAVHPREVLKPAVLLNSASIIVFHNHPSGNTEPSIDDIEISKRLKDAAELMGINFLDHIIVGDVGYLSLMEEYPHLRS
jgi:DNA repair protein RadC